MIYLNTNSTSPYYNLAFEEFCLKNLKEDVAIFWQNDNAIIIGKHQNTIEEINSQYVREHNIKVVRRISGGGAVYHDLGNLNYTFILNVERNMGARVTDFKEFALPVVKALGKMGVQAELSGRNDITIEGKKISGTAQRVIKNRLLYHGTLLFDSNLDVLTSALNVQKDKIESKGVKSVRSRVTNIKDHLQADYSIAEFKELLIKYLFEEGDYRFHQLSEAELAEVKALESDKYATWDWNYGESPKCNYQNAKRFAGGKIEILLNIANGIITDCKIYGDFLGITAVDEVEELITGKRYERTEIFEVLSTVDLKQYFGAITLEEILTCIFD